METETQKQHIQLLKLGCWGPTLRNEAKAVCPSCVKKDISDLATSMSDLPARVS